MKDLKNDVKLVKVEIIKPFFAEQTNTHYVAGAKVEVPEDLAKRHDADGTGFIKMLDK